MLTRTLIAAAALSLAGCATQGERASLGTAFVKDDRGHVIEIGRAHV